jgi:hypothetical protein
MLSRKKLKLIAALLAFMAVLALAYEAISHTDFYQELERLNLDNHQH